MHIHMESRLGLFDTTNLIQIVLEDNDRKERIAVVWTTRAVHSEWGATPHLIWLLRVGLVGRSSLECSIGQNALLQYWPEDMT